MQKYSDVYDRKYLLQYSKMCIRDRVGVVIGGGNFWRGRTSENIDRTKSDQIGMLATVMNCIYVSEIFRSVGMKTKVFTPFTMGPMAEMFTKDAAAVSYTHLDVYKRQVLLSVYRPRPDLPLFCSQL